MGADRWVGPWTDTQARAKSRPRMRLVDREAVQEACTAGRHQVFLAASTARVRGVPGGVAAARPIVMAQLRRAGGAARPVATRVIGAVGVGAAVRLRSGEHVVSVRRVADTV